MPLYTSDLAGLLGNRVDFASTALLPMPLSVPVGRDALPAVCRELGFRNGAEIGVWKAGFSRKLCDGAPGMHLLCVDPWQKYDGWEDGKNSPDMNIEAAYQIARETLKGCNATIVRAFSEDALLDVPDRSLDFVYIDGNHQRAAVLEDVTEWALKVRPGGIVAGHDYRVFPNKPYIQVVEALQDYTAVHEIRPWFQLIGDRTPSWLWVVRG